jgi:hypothetical protein
VIFELERVLLLIFSVVFPLGVYIFLYKKIAISRWTVVTFSLLLVFVAWHLQPEEKKGFVSGRLNDHFLEHC